jgi:DNA-binding CsgD family transcriptional regulator
MTTAVRSEGAPPDPAATRIHALWDELADFGAHETDGALVHAMRVLSDLVGARRAFWLGAVRVATEPDALGGWRIRAVRHMIPTPDGEMIARLSRQRLESGAPDAVTIAQVREAGVFRARLLRELASPEFLASADYDLIYRSRDVHDAVFVAFPVNQDAESYFGWYRMGEGAEPFAPSDRDVLAYALRALKWFHRRAMLHHGLLIARAPLTATERRLMSLLLTERAEKEIAHELGLTLATTHTYITDLFRKFDVSGRTGLTALWLGKSAS